MEARMRDVMNINETQGFSTQYMYHISINSLMPGDTYMHPGTGSLLIDIMIDQMLRCIMYWWHHQQLIVTFSAEHKTSEWDGFEVWRSLFLSPFINLLCHVRNKLMYVLPWRTVYAHPQVSFWCLFHYFATLEINTKYLLSECLNSLDSSPHFILYTVECHLCSNLSRYYIQYCDDNSRM